MHALLVSALLLVCFLTRRSHIQFPWRRNKLLPSRLWPNSGCHVVPYDWAMCHPMNGPYYLVINPFTYTVSYLPSHVPSTSSPYLPRVMLYVPRDMFVHCHVSNFYWSKSTPKNSKNECHVARPGAATCV
jgi:hypothetical protein